jgi:hypothetical protein
VAVGLVTGRVEERVLLATICSAGTTQIEVPSCRRV